jgi:hypothetical protein
MPGAVDDQAAIACRFNFARFVKRFVGNWVIGGRGGCRAHSDHEALPVPTAAESIPPRVQVTCTCFLSRKFTDILHQASVCYMPSP